MKKSPLAGKELYTKQLLDSTFWLKSISSGSSFFHLAKLKVLATINFEPGYALFLSSYSSILDFQTSDLSKNMATRGGGSVVPRSEILRAMFGPFQHFLGAI